MGRPDIDVHDSRQIPKAIPGEWFWEFVEDYEYAHRHEFCRGYPELALGPWELGAAWGRKLQLFGPCPKRSKQSRQSCFSMDAICLQEFPLHPIEECDDADDDEDDDDDDALVALEVSRNPESFPPVFASVPCYAMS